MTEGPSPVRPPQDDAVREYRERCREIAAEQDTLNRRTARVANARLGAFALAVVALFVVELGGMVAATLAGVAGIVFVVLVGWHGRLRGRLDLLATHYAINDEAIARIERRWEALPPAAVPPELPDHPYADDLDLFGVGSLGQLLGRGLTPSGRATLDRWFLEPAPPPEIADRQAGVQELAGRVRFRHQVESAARRMGPIRDSTLGRFLTWAEDSQSPLSSSWILPLGRVVGPVMGAISVALVIAWTQGVPVGLSWAVPLLFNLGVARLYQRRLHAVIDPVSATEATLQQYAAILDTVATTDFQADPLRRLAGPLGTEGANPHRELHRLHRLVHLADMRHSTAYFLVQSLTLWDFEAVGRLMAWRLRAGKHARTWLRIAGEFEALGALGALAHDNPDWGFPRVDAVCDRLSAESLAHPLLHRGARVANDVTVGPPGSFLFVTGSNMSGKSTLLRAIGCNAVLAQAGGPVCAARLDMPPIRLFTSMRVKDSLERGVSYFMAAVLRLKTIVEAVRGGHAALGTPLYLLDEILQGTNSAERQTAVRRIIRELVARGAIGAVTSHDLHLTDTPDLAEARVPVHFTETIADAPDGAVMRFDYRLRTGLATSSNALRLMELFGLGEELSG